MNLNVCYFKFCFISLLVPSSGVSHIDCKTHGKEELPSKEP